MASCRQRIIDRRYTKTLPQSFIDCEKERLILLDRPAQRRAEIVAFKRGQALTARRNPGIEEVARVQHAVAQVFKRGPVKLVASTLAADDNLAAPCHAVFSTKRIGDNFVFPNAIDSERCACGRSR